MDMDCSTVKHTESKLFNGYRTIGYVSNHVPCLVRYIFKRRQNFIISCTGHTFNTYASQKLKLLTVSGTHNEEINCMASDTYHVYTGAKNLIYAWRRGMELKHTYYGHEHDIKCLLPFAQHLLSIDLDGVFCMFDIKSEERKWSVRFSNDFTPTCIMHPHTYINQILVGSKQGTFQLFDVNEVHAVDQFEGWGSEITQIIQAPAIDIVGISLADKRVILHNLKEDTTIMTLKCIDKPISLAFRTDGPEFLIVGSDTGSLTVWDLASQEMISYNQDAHRAPVGGVQCFQEEPLFVTSSADNSLHVWIFDMPDGGYRSLCVRGGHYEPSNRIKFYGNPAYNILSAGRDATLRTFHIYNETYSRCISKARIPIQRLKMKATESNYSEYMPPIVDFTAESVTNPKHHADTAACHEGQLSVSTWSLANTKRDNKVLLPPTHDKNTKVATCLYMSSCGQFVLVGYDSGAVHMYNIQSARHRRTYGKPYAHDGPVRGVAIDQTNTMVVTGGVDGILKFWRCTSGELDTELPLKFSISYLFDHRDSGLVGVILDNCSLLIVDISSRKVFRRFTEISSPILNACFSPDNRWLTASTSDCLVRTWDVPTSSLIDVFRLESMVSSMDYSPNGELLATALHDTVGILLWMNKTLYVHVSLMPLPADFEPPLIGMPAVEAINITDIGEIRDQDLDFKYQSVDQIDENLVTLSLLPTTKWKNLLHLDTIRMRNRPKQPPKTYVAPFFLSALVGNEESGRPEQGTSSSSKILQLSVNLSPFAKKLENINDEDNCCMELCDMLAAMSSTKIESEFQTLGPFDGGSIELLQKFLIFSTQLIRSNRWYEASQAYLALFLKIHGETIRSHDVLLEELRTLQIHFEKRDEVIRNQITTILAYTYYLKSTLFN